MAEIEAFTVLFPEQRISQLKQRLQQALFPDELPDSGWDMGTPLSDIERIAKHWASKFDFQQAAAQLNELPQFKTKIDCEGFDPLSIHFVHLRSDNPNAIPLFFSHGWPGSFFEVYKIARQLTRSDNGGPCFHVVAPSLPNFGFSDGVKKRGFAIEQYATVCNQLMLKLGYERYVTQGGDWGEPPASLKSTQPGSRFPLPDGATPRELQGAQRTAWFLDEGYGYNLLQSTKPQTLAYALADSPLALLAWISEKLHDWTDNYPWTDDEICLWVSIYYFSTAGPAAATRIYYEMAHDRNGKYVPKDSMGKGFEGGVPGTQKITGAYLKKDHGTGVKIGMSHFPMDIQVLPSLYTNTLGNVVYEKEHERGGHFAAHECPDELASDLREMFGALDLRSA
ncbi:hypothetical protein LTR05_007474 [Lithohypha guttulata]|uniref:Epoxide hydrolase N-terminal domain-containing protein n=1 Tax=Lithohypha guttulata TaxID=1690604 RepID=A0AAN7Y4E8_9EURO|nr:hypothetical protein LTR05_007474 [Lithohypha guttulata]